MFFFRYRKALLDRRIGPYIRRGPTNAVRAAAADCGGPPCIAARIPSATRKPLFLPQKERGTALAHPYSSNRALAPRSNYFY